MSLYLENTRPTKRGTGTQPINPENPLINALELDVSKHLCWHLDAQSVGRLKQTCKALNNNSEISSNILAGELLRETAQLPTLLAACTDLHEWIAPWFSCIPTLAQHINADPKAFNAFKNVLILKLKIVREQVRQEFDSYEQIKHIKETLDYIDRIGKLRPDSPQLENEYLLLIGLSECLAACSFLSEQSIPLLEGILKRVVQISDERYRAIFLINVSKILPVPFAKYSHEKNVGLFQMLLHQAQFDTFVLKEAIPLPLFNLEDFPALKNDIDCMLRGVSLTALGEIVIAITSLTNSEIKVLLPQAVMFIQGIRREEVKIASFVRLIAASNTLPIADNFNILLGIANELKTIRPDADSQNYSVVIIEIIKSSFAFEINDAIALLNLILPLIHALENEQRCEILNEILDYVFDADFLTGELVTFFITQFLALADITGTNSDKVAWYLILSKIGSSFNEHGAYQLLLRALRLMNASNLVDIERIRLIFSLSEEFSELSELTIEIEKLAQSLTDPAHRETKFFLYLYLGSFDEVVQILDEAFANDSNALRSFIAAALECPEYYREIEGLIKRHGLRQHTNILQVLITCFSVDEGLDLALTHLEAYRQSNARIRLRSWKEVPPPNYSFFTCLIEKVDSEERYLLCKKLIEVANLETDTARANLAYQVILDGIPLVSTDQASNLIQNLLNSEELDEPTLYKLAGVCSKLYLKNPTIIFKGYLEEIARKGKAHSVVLFQVIEPFLVLNPNKAIELVYLNHQHKTLLLSLRRFPTSFWSDHTKVLKLYKNYVLKNVAKGSIGHIAFLMASLQGQSRSDYKDLNQYDDLKAGIPIGTAEKITDRYFRFVKDFKTS